MSGLGRTSDPSKRRGLPRRMGTWLAAVLVVPAIFAALLPSAAQARPTHRFSNAFGSVSQPTFGNAAGIAVNPSDGDLLVIDLGSQTLSRFKPDGSPAPFSALAGNVIDGQSGEEDATPEGEILSTEVSGNPIEAQVAVSPPGAVGGTEGDIYVTDAFIGKVDIFESTGKYIGQRSFGYPCGVATDSAGDLLVGSFEGQAGVYKLIPSAPGAFSESSASPFPFQGGPLDAGPCQVAAGVGPTQGFVFATAYNGEVVKIASEGSEEGSLEYTALEGQHATVSVDPSSGDVYAAASSAVEQVDASGSAPSSLDRFAASAPVQGVAFNAGGTIYLSESGSSAVAEYDPVTVVTVSTGSASDVHKATATLNGTINDEGTEVTECFFEYGETASYGSTAPCALVDGTPIAHPDEIPKDGSVHAVSAEAALPAVNTEYHYRLVAANSVERVTGLDETFKSLGPPLIDSESVSGITEARARIGGSIEARGEATTFVVEYVSDAQFLQSGYGQATKAPVPPRPIGSGLGPVAVSQEIGGLTPGTTYHFRLVATNATDSPVVGPDKTFATLPELGGLPDGRTYEMVSPPRKGGEVFPPESEGMLGGSCFHCLPGTERQRMAMQASLDGSSLAYEGQPFEAGLGGEANEYLARRDPLTGWTSDGLSGPKFRTAPSGEQVTGFLAFSSDLSRGVLSQAQPSLAPEAPAEYPNLYIWQRDAALQPLITSPPPTRSADGTEHFEVRYAGANSGEGSSPPYSHVVFAANDALTGETAAAPPAPPVGPSDLNLYEWNDGRLRLVNVLPGNAAAAPGAVIGSGHLNQPHPDLESPAFNNAVSANGERIIFTYPGSYEDPPGSSNFVSAPLLDRISGDETVELDALQPGAPGFFSGGGQYRGATPDGDKVFFTDSGGLTSGAHLFEGADLYVYDFEQPEAERLTDLTTGPSPAEVQGLLGISEDGNYVYFVAQGVLTEEEENANHEKAESGADNLYVWHDGSTRFIGELLDGDNREFELERMGDWKTSPSDRMAQVSPDGRYLAFTSVATLTGFDNTHRDGEYCDTLASPTRCSEVFEYDAVSGKLVCASCNPTGERPLGHSNLSLVRHTSGGTFFPQPRNLTTGGRLFFESQDVLSAGDTNGLNLDVYEWEPDGVGTCGRSAGCQFLISSGHSSSYSLFLDATPDGDDAFFVTRQALVRQDEDELFDVYDARVGGGGFVDSGASSCSGDACRGAASPAPPEATVGSEVLSGPGNQHHRRKHRRRKHHRRKRQSRPAIERGASHNKGGAK